MATTISLAALSYFVNEHKGYFLALAAKVHCCGHNIFDASCCCRYRPLPASATAASLSMKTPCYCCPKRVVLLTTGVVGVVEVLNRRNYAKSVEVGISAYIYIYIFIFRSVEYISQYSPEMPTSTLLA